MKIAKLIAWLGVMAMTVVLIYGFSAGDFFEDGSKILNNPWGIVSMVDLYVGFILFSVWIVFRERNILVSLIWVMAMMILGFFAGALYVALNLHKSKGDLEKFFFGKWKGKYNN